jgi:conjugal transfer/entry exclusion protein
MLKGALLAKNFEAQSLKVSVQLLDKQWRGKKPESYKRGTDSQNSIEQLCEAPSS